MTRAMLLCAGLGTRLGALSDTTPKPMLPVCGYPILRYGIALLVGHGIRDIVINVHHRGEAITRVIGDGSAFGARVQYTYEEQLLGTGGGLKHALGFLDPDGTDEPFVSMNGKLIFDLDVTALLDAFARDPGILGMMVVQPVPDAKAWGAVDVRPNADGHLRVHDVLGDGNHMFCGVHVTRPSVMARLPDGESDSIRQGYLPWLRGGEQVAAYEHRDGYFAEHSTPARYLDSNFAVLRGARLRHPPGAIVAVDPSAVIGAGAEIGPDAVIGAGAVIAPGVRVTRSVVWPGARVDADAIDVIVTPAGVVPRSAA